LFCYLNSAASRLTEPLGTVKKQERKFVMGTILLIIALVIEAAFAAGCIVTKSNQAKVRSYVRIGAFAAFVLFTLASIIQWSFRWYALAALLLVWAALGAWTLIARKAEKDEYKAKSIVRRAIGALLLVVIVMVPAFIFPQHQSPKITGKYEVATVNYTYTDKSRIETFTNTGENRKVNVEFWYPKDADGTYPLVVFSPGIFGMKTSNTSTFMELASNGYVVCSIDHPYHSLFTIDTNGNRTIINNAFLQEYMNVSNGKYDAATTFKLEHGWMGLRIADINFVLDTILAQTQAAGSDAVYQLIDPEKIGLMGHSLGGESSAQVARERNDIGAVINLDADLAGEYVDFVNGKEVLNDKVYPVPILNILSDTLERLIAAVPEANTIVAVKHVTATAPNAFEVHLAGTDHMSFTDLPLISPFLVSMINASVPKAGGHEADALTTIEKMNDIVLDFFNVYLKGEGTFTYSGTY
jgi:dienelactone hydrolase/FtsH-binding integral membrane protein